MTEKDINVGRLKRGEASKWYKAIGLAVWQLSVVYRLVFVGDLQVPLEVGNLKPKNDLTPLILHHSTRFDCLLLLNLCE